jgi:hypothetical protein
VFDTVSALGGDTSIVLIARVVTKAAKEVAMRRVRTLRIVNLLCAGLCLSKTLFDQAQVLRRSFGIVIGTSVMAVLPVMRDSLESDLLSIYWQQVLKQGCLFKRAFILPRPASASETGVKVRARGSDMATLGTNAKYDHVRYIAALGL